MNKSIHTNKLLLLLLLTLSMQSFSQTSTSWTGANSTAWSLSTNWTNGVPSTTKNAVIGDSYFTGAYQPKISTTALCNSLTIGGVNSANLNISQSLKVYGNISMLSNGIITHTVSTLFLKGNWSNNGQYLTTSTSRVVLFGSIQDIGGDSVISFRRLLVSSGSTLVMSNDINVTGSGGYIYVYGVVDPGTNYTLNSDVSNVLYNGGKLKVNKATFTQNYNLSVSLVINTGGIVEYSATSVNQTISSSLTYSTLMISGSGVKSLTSNLSSFNSNSNASGKIIVNSGTLDLSSYTANRGTTVAGGELNIASGAILKLSGSNNFPNNFTTVTINAASTVDYYGSTQSISSQAYGNLILEGAGTKSATADFSVAGDFSIQSATLSTAANVMIVSVKGSFIMNGGSSLSGSNATYQLNGTSDQSLNLLSSLVNFKINKSSGSVILTSDVTVTNNLTFLSGIIKTDNNNLIVEPSASIVGASQSTGWVFGNLKRGLSASGAVTKTFDIGSSNYYSPATVAFTAVAAGGYITATVIDSDHPELDYSGVNPTKSVNNYWSFINEGVSYSPVNLTLSWNSSNADAGLDVNNLLLGKFNGTDWSKYSITTEVANSVDISNVTALEDFAIGQKISQYHWTGDAYSTDWNTPKNWYGGVPDSSSDVTIPNPLGGRRNYPTIIATQTCKVGNLLVESDGALIVDDGTLQIFGNATNQGLFDATNGTVEFSGISGDQTIASGLFTNNKVKNLIISNNVYLAYTDSITGTLTVNDGKTFYTQNNLVLKSDANGTARIAELPTDGSGRATAFIDGRVSIERFIPARKAWRLLSSPIKASSAQTICGAWQESAYGSSFTNNLTSNTNQISNPDPVRHYGAFILGGSTANGFDQSLTSLPSIKYYDNASNTFTGLPASPGTLRPITDYNGYMIYIRGDRSIDLNLGTAAPVTSTTLRVKGEVITGNYAVDVNAQRYTVFGNPYASPINFGTIDKNNVKNSFYIWDPRLAGSNGLGAYVTVSYNSGTGTYDVTTSASAISQYIPSGEAVLVESADGSRAGTITVKESDKTSSGSDMLFGKGNNTTKVIRANLMEAQADGIYNLLDGSMTSYHDNNSNAYDNNDVTKLKADGESIAFSSYNHALAIERRKTITGADTSFINMVQLSKKQYRLDIIAENMQHDNLIAVVADKYLATTSNMPVDLKGTTHIDFTVNNDPASAAANRFSIIFNAQPKINVSNNTIELIEKKQVVTEETASVSVFPNPVTGNVINVNLKNMAAGNYNLKLYNITGQLVSTQQINYSSKNASIKMKIPAGVAAGKYELKVEGEGKVVNTSLLKQ